MQTGYVLRDIAPRHLRASVQETSDETLIGLIAEGDKRAMQILYARHNVRVYRFILRFTSNPSMAEDLVSEVFLDIWRGAAEFSGKSNVSTWLLGIARNKTMSALRRRTEAAFDHDIADARVRARPVDDRRSDQCPATRQRGPPLGSSSSSVRTIALIAASTCARS